MGDEDHLDRCSKRTRPVLISSRGEEFYVGRLIGPLSSIPRWNYDRALEEVDREDGSPMTADAIKRIIREKREITTCRNSDVEHFFNLEGVGGELGSLFTRRACANRPTRQGRMSALFAVHSSGRVCSYTCTGGDLKMGNAPQISA